MRLVTKILFPAEVVLCSQSENTRTVILVMNLIFFAFPVEKRLLHNNRLSNIFTNRAVDCWNSLPNECVNVESYAVFARKIKQLDLSEFLKGMP